MTQAPEQTMLMRNRPMSARDWGELLEVSGVTMVDAEVGQLAIVPDRGQLTLSWAFTDIDMMRLHYQAMFDALKPAIAEADVDFITLDFVQVQNRDWLIPLLDATTWHH